MSMEEVSEARIAQNQQRLQARALKLSEGPQDLVGMVVFLCLLESDFMTGQTLVVDGGAQMTLSAAHYPCPASRVSGCCSVPTLAQQGRGADGFQRPLLRRIAVALLLLRVWLTPVFATGWIDRCHRASLSVEQPIL